MKILLVEDTRAVAAIMAARLTSFGHEVSFAENGQVAFDRFRESPPDLVLMDIEMPVMNGYETTKRIRAFEATQKGAWTPIIFLTASDTPENLVTAIEAGGDDFLAKGLSEDVLHAKMKAMARIAAMRRQLDVAHHQIEIEQERSEKLLLNILPGAIADRLRTSDQTIADGFADVTVMFADIVNYTQRAASMSPSEVFAMLNRVFSAFDELAEQFGLEKIKTIGDAYMVAGGLGEDRSNHTAAIADMALGMRDLLRRDFTINASHLEIRVGIGTGPIVAGVLGKKKFIYDLWGDTVNLASRLTSEGAPGMIQCDTTTYQRLAADFEFQEPQTVYLKGKGNMTMYHLLGRKHADSGEQSDSPAKKC